MSKALSSANAYEFLKERFETRNNLAGASAILNKDTETVMAKGSGEDRIKQLTAIADAHHAIIADPRIEEALQLAAETDLSPADRRNLELMHHEWVHNASLPADLAKERARVEAEGDQLHTELYGTGNWVRMGEWYKRSFDVAREAGQIKQEKLHLSSPYEALVDQFSPGLRLAVINEEFKNLDTALRPMIQAALEKQAQQTPPLEMKGPFPFGKQKKLGREMAQAIGFDFNRGVQYAIKGHPSMGGNSDDVRITARLSKSDVVPGIYGMIHETGHAVYQQNLPKEWRYQPVGEAMGMAVHESQSMIMEYQAAMTPEFLEYIAGRLQVHFKKAGDPAFSAENIKAIQTQVRPSFIRVEADEMTYSMHILLRTDLESKMISGELNVADLPDAWNEGMRERLGITPANAAQGCMQDVHWPVGLVGYFPAYTFGAMGAAQFFQAALKARPEISAELKQGSTASLREWLSEHVHGRGSLVSVEKLFSEATGETLNAKPYLNHLSSRYLGRAYQP